MSVSGCRNHYEFVLHAGAKAKSVTSLLTLPSVLAVAFYSIIVKKTLFSFRISGSRRYGTTLPFIR